MLHYTIMSLVNFIAHKNNHKQPIILFIYLLFFLLIFFQVSTGSDSDVILNGIIDQSRQHFSLDNTINVTFQSDSSFEYRGFSAEYTG